MIPDFVLVFCGVAPRAYHFHILDTAIVLAPWTLAMSSATSGSNTQFVVVVQQMVLCRLCNRKGMCD